MAPRRGAQPVPGSSWPSTHTGTPDDSPRPVPGPVRQTELAPTKRVPFQGREAKRSSWMRRAERMRAATVEECSPSALPAWADRLKMHRVVLRMSQEALAVAIGVDESTVRKWG